MKWVTKAKAMYEKDIRPVTIMIRLYVVFIVAPPLWFITYQNANTTLWYVKMFLKRPHKIGAYGWKGRPWSYPWLNHREKMRDLWEAFTNEVILTGFSITGMATPQGIHKEQKKRLTKVLDSLFKIIQFFGAEGQNRTADTGIFRPSLWKLER